MALHSGILEHLSRLEVPVPENLERTAIEILVHEVTWPKQSFHSPWERLRATFIANGADAAEWDIEYLLDESIFNGPRRTVHLNFFQDTPGEFYTGWRGDFTGTDPTATVPWAHDWAYFFFLAENENDPSDPIIMVVDHEETDEKPFRSNGLTVSQ